MCDIIVNMKKKYTFFVSCPACDNYYVIITTVLIADNQFPSDEFSTALKKTGNALKQHEAEKHGKKQIGIYGFKKT